MGEVKKECETSQPERATESPTQQPSALCNHYLRDPLTVAISFMPWPGQFRSACQFTRECWEQALFLEGQISCPYVVVRCPSSDPPFPTARTDDDAPHRNSRATIPVSIGNLHKLGFGGGKIGSKSRGAQLQSVDYWCRTYTLYLSLPKVHRLKRGESLNRGSFPMGLGVEKVVTVPGGLNSLRRIDASFLQLHRTLKEVCFQDLPKLEEIGTFVLAKCSVLAKVELLRLPQLRHIDALFLSFCPTLEYFALEDLPKLQAVGRNLLYGCLSLKEFRMAHLPELLAVRGFSVSSCPKLQKVTLLDLPRLSAPHYGFLHDCGQLDRRAIHQEGVNFDCNHRAEWAKKRRAQKL